MAGATEDDIENAFDQEQLTEDSRMNEIAYIGDYFQRRLEDDYDIRTIGDFVHHFDQDNKAQTATKLTEIFENARAGTVIPSRGLRADNFRQQEIDNSNPSAVKQAKIEEVTFKYRVSDVNIGAFNSAAALLAYAKANPNQFEERPRLARALPARKQAVYDYCGLMTAAQRRLFVHNCPPPAAAAARGARGGGRARGRGRGRGRARVRRRSRD